MTSLSTRPGTAMERRISRLENEVLSLRQSLHDARIAQLDKSSKRWTLATWAVVVIYVAAVLTIALFS